ncbi:heparan-alpha-glucosaminide N-acetyltransferase [Atopobium fossor]|uniref:heparan-alpha-glucosaminide N-acetyltransferase n=1 Tax=Atopobium fossor TaxID=39487 RepID=UPI001FE1ED6C|nr:heparan-alpha-glucosaminide N-acetyltransferase [Atopobium fossor]
MQSVRVHGFDAVRGIAVISMVAFHLCYDLATFTNVSLPWFSGVLEIIWRNSISWTFLFIAGCMSCYSRSNIKRSFKLLTLAATIFVLTSIVAVDTPINFGIIFCLGASSLVVGTLQQYKIKISGVKVSALLILMFLALLHLNDGYLELMGISYKLPYALYSTPYFSWLGLPGPGFTSGDYYPVLPYTLMFLAGWSFCSSWKEAGISDQFVNVSCKPLEFIGKHALLVYILHQPLLLGLLQVIS